MFPQEGTDFAVQLTIGDVTKAWKVVKVKLWYSAVNIPAWNK